VQKLNSANDNWAQKSWIEYETTTVRNLRKKVIDNNLVLTQAEKGKMIVILHHEEYNQEVAQFMESSHPRIQPKNTKDNKTRI
jgi:hypothetical protein